MHGESEVGLGNKAPSELRFTRSSRHISTCDMTALDFGFGGTGGRSAEKVVPSTTVATDARVEGIGGRVQLSGISPPSDDNVEVLDTVETVPVVSSWLSLPTLRSISSTPESRLTSAERASSFLLGSARRPSLQTDL